MEDVFKFLLVIAVIAVGFVRQAKKEAKKKAANSPAMPTSEKGNPLPENWGDGTYGGYIPEGLPPEAIVIPEKSERQKPLKAKPADSKNTIKEPSRYMADSLKQPPPSMSIIEESDEASEFGIHSADEARRAIIWSEILQRKY